MGRFWVFFSLTLSVYSNSTESICVRTQTSTWEQAGNRGAAAAEGRRRLRVKTWRTEPSDVPPATSPLLSGEHDTESILACISLVLKARVVEHKTLDKNKIKNKMIRSTQSTRIYMITHGFHQIKTLRLKCALTLIKSKINSPINPTFVHSLSG